MAAPRPQQLLLLLLVSLLAARRADAWGKEGHIMTCKIAERYLSEDAAAAVRELLPASAGGELSAMCPWADEVRFRYHWASPLHYANTPNVCNFKSSRADGDCHNTKGMQGMCVVGAINNYTDQLLTYRDSTKSSYNLTESLMFLAHFVGDVHQPLHVSFEEDEGGNTIQVHWYRRKANLHHVWDVSIIDTVMKDFYNKDMDTMVDALQMNLTNGWSDDISHWENCANKKATCANDYAIESIGLACNYAYKDVTQNITLGDDYYFTRYPVVEKRLAQGGIRLALILNRIFDKKKVDAMPLYAQ